MQINKQKKTSITINILTIILALSCFTFQLGYRVAARPGAATEEAIWEPGTQLAEASYIIWKEDSTYYARNGTTGAVQYSGTNASQIIENVLDTNIQGIIHFKAGIYSITTMGIYIQTGQTIQGEGYGTIFDGAATGSGAFKLNSGIENVTIKNLLIRNFKDVGIQIVGPTQNILVENVHIQQIYHSVGIISHGIVINGDSGNCDNIKILHNTIKNIGIGSGVVCNGISLPTDPTAGHYVQNCSFIGNSIVGVAGYGIQQYFNSRLNQFSENHLTDTQNGGMYLTESINNIINDNAFYDIGAFGILVRDASHHNTISNNVFNHIGSYGIRIDDIDKQSGASNSRANYNIISGNIFWDCNYDQSGYEAAIYISNCTGTSITGNTISDSQLGVHLNYDCTGTEITGNTIYQNERDGIRISAGTFNQTLVTITANAIYDNDQEGVAFNGITLTNCVYVTITGNSIFDSNYHGGQAAATQTYSIETTGTSDYNIIVGNNCYRSSHSTTDISYTGTNNKVAYNQGRYTAQGAA